MWSDFSSEPNRPAPTSTHSTRDKEKGTLPQRLIEPGLPSHQRFTPPAWESVVFILFLMENHLGGEAVRNVMIGSVKLSFETQLNKIGLFAFVRQRLEVTL